MDTKFDNEFEQIKNLKWLPFIGSNYATVPQLNKLLIVGESHYHDNSTQSIQKHNAIDYTRVVIEELAIKRRYWNTKIFQNFHKALFQNDNFDANLFWNLVSFYNFIQKPMETNKGRPGYDDFYNSWTVFFEIIKIIKPKTCIFIGTKASNSLHNAISNSSLVMKSFEKEPKISRTYPRKAILTNNQDLEVELIFIQHTSKYFSWSKWNKYLQSIIEKQLTWLSTKIQ